LFQDALQAQMVLNRMSEIIESPPPTGPVSSKTLSSSFLPSAEQLDNSKESEADEENNIEVTNKFLVRIP